MRLLIPRTDPASFALIWSKHGHRDVVKPAPLHPAVPGGFTVDDFTVDHAEARVTCPED